ncbi:hypothetical protein [Glycomyces harbinensis]|uniref:Uncharacterized protein n=1 Tax=Glycomyces harbinensis TaxID=58114 RepID=A0A1G7DBE4_9ACTN|nr:hypothetical protein [Glycomyces harbinensis]SDE48881.1 hypothetical protein SAMN05216270_1243 [Glycomyces harbinensis]
MPDRHATDHDGSEQQRDSREGEHFGLTPEEERRGTPLQQEAAGDVPRVEGDQDEPVPDGPAPGES